MRAIIIGGLIVGLLAGAAILGRHTLREWRGKQRAAQAAKADLVELEASQRCTCRNFLRLIETAKEQWAHEKAERNGTEPSWSDLSGYLGGSTLTCPNGGKYQLNAVGTKPVCSIHNHAD